MQFKKKTVLDASNISKLVLTINVFSTHLRMKRCFVLLADIKHLNIIFELSLIVKK